jgi:long-chain acyl-CoA synthetase
MNLANLLRRAGLAFPEHTAIALGERPVYRYRELAKRAGSIARSLRETLGLEPGERVALAMRNCPQYVELMFAGWHAGLTVVPINAKLHQREFEYILGHAGAKVCFVTGELAEVVGPLRSSLADTMRVVCVDDPEYDALAAGDPDPIADRQPDDVAWLFYTSGTTGRPKGAMLTHRNLLAMTTSYFADVDRIAPDDCILHAAPMSHGSGVYILPHVAAAAAHVIPVSGGFDPPEVFELMHAHPGMSMFAAPTMVRRLVDSTHAAVAETRNLKTIVYGGGPMYLEDCKRAMQVLGYKLAQIYGQGESPMTITALSKGRHADVDHPRYEQRLASVGIAHTVVEVRVADDQDRTLPPEALGEVLVRGEAVMKGYWRDEHASASTLRGGWLHTGDIGSLDEDGFLTLRDRSKDLIISGGSNIYPREVEEVLLRHPAVAEAAVVGKPHPDWGEETVAFVVLRPGFDAIAQDLDALCLDHVARFKRPKFYRFVASLPKNHYGKVLKTALREQLETPEQDNSGR